MGRFWDRSSVTLLLTSAASFWITQHRVNQQAEEAFRDKVRQIAGMAGATRAWFSENIDMMVPGQKLQARAAGAGRRGMERGPAVRRGAKDGVPHSIADPAQSQESAG